LASARPVRKHPVDVVDIFCPGSAPFGAPVDAGMAMRGAIFGQTFARVTDPEW
jgi:hypothetical protein